MGDPDAWGTAAVEPATAGDRAAVADVSLRVLLECEPGVLLVLDRAGRTRFVTESAVTVLGHPAETLLGRHFREVVDLRDLPELERAFAELVDAPVGATMEREFRFRHRDGATHWLHGTASNQLQTAGVEGVVVHWRDITTPRELRTQLEYAATHDMMTGLSNRALFVDHLDLALGRVARHPDEPVAVLFCDLDQFKVINDSLGHPAGDDLLRQVADRLRRAVRPGDTVARLGGDEFAILCGNLSGARHAATLAERALAAVTGTYRLTGVSRPVHVGASIGVAISSGASSTATDLLREADTALYEAKRRGRHRVELFSHQLREAVTARLRLESDLCHGLERGEFALYYQPKLHLRSGRFFSAEALLRWNHPDRGPWLPEAFLDVARDTGVIIPLGRWVMRTAVAQVAAWHREGLDLSVQINVSATELADPGFVPDLADAISGAGVDPGNIELEITEPAAFADLQGTATTVAAIRERGVHVTLQGFGSGSSSLTTLQHIPVDGVKLDGAFARFAGRGSRSATIVEAVLNLGHALELSTFADGVEAAEEQYQLERFGCDAAQGQYIAPPTPATQLHTLPDVNRRG
jgi:diguanylate cyclase (GGDEF)-like protein/PAS domain S-box-containing protein